MATEANPSELLVDGVPVARVAEPGTVEELQAIVLAASHANERLLLAGGGTRLAFGNAGGPFDLAVSMRRLNRIIAYEPDDLTVAVEPGVTLAQLDGELAAHGQHLVLDSAHRAESTIGGAFATGLSGPRRLRYGALKENALGIEVLTSDGTPTKAGGMVVKNVTGFDMMRLHYGALGAFGFITRLNFKVVPRPEAALYCRAEFGSAAQAHAAAVAMLGSGVELAALYVTANAADSWTLHAVVDGGAEAAERQARHIGELAGDAIVEPLAASAAPGFETFLDLAADRTVARIAMPASRQLELLERMQFSGSEQLCADLGSGLVYIATLPKVEWRVALRRLDARAVFLSLPPEQKLNLDVLAAEPGPALDVLRRLKHEFDPSGRFNHGRFVAGL